MWAPEDFTDPADVSCALGVSHINSTNVYKYNLWRVPSALHCLKQGEELVPPHASLTKPLHLAGYREVRDPMSPGIALKSVDPRSTYKPNCGQIHHGRKKDKMFVTLTSVNLDLYPHAIAIFIRQSLVFFMFLYIYIILETLYLFT